MLNKQLLVSLSIILVFQTFAQTQSKVSEEFEDKIAAYQRENSTERVYLHLDKTKMIPGETLWYSAYVVFGPTHSYSNQSRVLHVDLINRHNQVIVSKKHLIENGKSFGEISFPTSSPEGDYMLRAYTNWMRNFDDRYFFSKEIEVVLTSYENPVSLKNEELNFSFFPEGGQMINGLNGRVAFKVVNEQGEGVSEMLEGRIVDSEGVTITYFKSLNKGMGTFFLKPESGKSYYAIMPEGSEYPLPDAEDQGFSMMASSNNPASIKLTVNSSEEYIGEEVHLVGTLENRVVFNNTYPNKNGRIEFEIPTSDLPKGILTLTLLDNTKNPKSKRHLFIQNDQSLRISTNLKKDDDEEKMVLGVKITDEEGNPVSTNLSMAITDADFDDKSEMDNLASHFLIKSNTIQSIEKSGSFAISDDRTSLLKADLLMLTSSFKSPDWEEVMNPTASVKQFDVARGLPVSGTAVWEDGLPLKNKELRAVSYANGDVRTYVVITDENGSFSFNSFDQIGTANIIFSAYGKKGKLLPIRVTLNETEPDLPVPNYSFPKSEEEAFSESDTAAQQAFSEEQAAYATFDEDATFLDEVTVEGVKIEEERTPSVLGVTPSATRIIDENNVDRMDYLQVLNTIPGVRYNGRGPTATVTIQGPVSFGATSPLWVLDGVILSPDVNNGGSNVPTFVTTLNPSAVDRIEVVKGAEAAIFGSRGGAGVIIIYTKQGGSSYTSPTSNLEVKGYDVPMNFNAASSENTNRFTLYWNPSIITDENGEANIEFYNSSNAENIQIDIQGLSNTGLMGIHLEKAELQR